MPIPVMGDGLPPALLALLGPEVEVLPWDTAPHASALARAEAVITYGHPLVDGPLLDRMPRVRVVSNHGVGVDHIDLHAAQARGIPVGNTPGCLDDATADMTLALLLALARNVVSGDRYARSPQFTHYDPAWMIGQEVTGAMLGIIGLGRIGQQVARRAQAFDMRIVYHNRNRNPAAEQASNATWLPLDELLSQSDFVTLNCPLSPATTGLIGARELRLMRPTAGLINMARGPVVATDALSTALSERWIRGAALDVTDPEPLPRDHPLLKLDNVIITPHLGSAAGRTRQKMLEMTVANLRAGLQGQPLPWRITA